MRRLLWLLALAPVAAWSCSSGGDSGSGGGGSDSGSGAASVSGSGSGSGSGSVSGSGAGGSGGGGGSGGAGGVMGDPCDVDGNPGVCVDTATCATMTDHTATPGHCPGPADIQCCTTTPNVDDNPPIPDGYVPMMQAEVTPDMTDWAVMILDDPDDYPMFATAMRTFGTLDVLARVEWHPPDFQNEVVHRGVTLYEPE